MTLITALAFTVVVGTVLAGVGNVALSHYGRSTVERSYANAIALADAGVNYEIRLVSSTPNNTSTADQPGNPYVGSVPGVPGTFSVYVTRWDKASNTCSNLAWTDAVSQDACITSTGTIDSNMSRRVQVRAIHRSVFDDYVLYAISSGTFGGGGSGTNSTTIIGDFGTNGTVTYNGTKGTNTVQGTVSNNGSGATSNQTGSNTVNNPDPVQFPTVSDLANSLFPGGLTYLQTHNSNASIRMLKSTDTSWASEPTVSGITLADLSTGLASAGFSVSSRTFSDPPNSVPADTATIDDSASSSSSWRFVYPGSVYGTSSYGIKGKKVYFVPPGDYYFNNLDFKSGNAAVVFLTHLGTIRIWVDNPTSGPTPQDYLQTVAVFTDLDSKKFRVYYNKCQDLNIAGNSVFPGGFYAVNPVCGPTEPEVKFTGGTTIYGSVIAQYFTLGGSTQVIFPNNAGGVPEDAAIWFGFKDSWQEIRFDGDTTKPVFVDGTSN